MISIVIPALNAERTIEGQLAALAGQRYEGTFEVIVADNGSTDGTRAAAERWADRLPGLRVIDASARPGSASARNAGVRAARGTAIAFCDSDDVVTEGWLAALADKLDSAPLVAGWFDLLEEASGRVVWPAEPRPISMGFLRYADTSSMAVERAALEAVGGFTEELLRCSDRDLSWKLQLAGYEMVEAPDALVYKMSRGTLWERVVQAYRWGQFEPMLYKRYRDAGMRRPSLASTLRDVAWILITTPLIWYPRARAVWWRTAPVHVGRIAGCRDARCWYP